MSSTRASRRTPPRTGGPRGGWSGRSSAAPAGVDRAPLRLPGGLRALAGSGFTPGFASVLVCEDGSRHFVKAASVKAQRLFADSYREEARSSPRSLRACPRPG